LCALKGNWIPVISESYCLCFRCELFERFERAGEDSVTREDFVEVAANPDEEVVYNKVLIETVVNC